MKNTIQAPAPTHQRVSLPPEAAPTIEPPEMWPLESETLENFKNMVIDGCLEPHTARHLIWQLYGVTFDDRLLPWWLRKHDSYIPPVSRDNKGNKGTAIDEMTHLIAMAKWLTRLS